MKTIIEILTNPANKDKAIKQALDYAIERVELIKERERNYKKMSRLMAKTPQLFTKPAPVEEYIDPLGWYDAEKISKRPTPAEEYIDPFGMDTNASDEDESEVESEFDKKYKRQFYKDNGYFLDDHPSEEEKQWAKEYDATLYTLSA